MDRQTPFIYQPMVNDRDVLYTQSDQQSETVESYDCQNSARPHTVDDLSEPISFTELLGDHQALYNTEIT